MAPLGRFRVAALHCLFLLAALSSKTYAASVAAEPIRTDPHAARVSVAVEADGSLMARQKESHPHKVSMDVAPGGDAELHHGRDSDEDQIRKLVVIGADGSVGGDVLDLLQKLPEVDTDVGSDEKVVRQKLLQSADFEGLSQEDGSAGESAYVKFTSEAAALIRTRDGGDVAVVFLVLILLGTLITGAVFFFLWFNKSEHRTGASSF